MSNSTGGDAALTTPKSASDLERELAAAKTREAEILEEKENYKKMAFKYKKRASGFSYNDDDDEDEMDSRLSKIEGKIANIAKSSNEEIARITRERDEALATLNASRHTGAGGSGSVNTENKSSQHWYWSTEQMASLKQRGWSDERIELAAKNAKARS
jgi:hypothetical protein